jgi:hypothetical protein
MIAMEASRNGIVALIPLDTKSPPAHGYAAFDERHTVAKIARETKSLMSLAIETAAESRPTRVDAFATTL